MGVSGRGTMSALALIVFGLSGWVHYDALVISPARASPSSDA
ncbi:hypothetical protein sce1409 [Sorangium cellulosum So ce56]|uniref:Uncharacterized protein n=1 Tax=Sorangium cellulosum (strain So ce56) TaxID=448385 RepID=A9F7T2_SORC5|nr:hypothetical protein sce1409 [Sorangium cellulosum So ce56]